MSLRDVVDYLDYDVDPRVWIESLLGRIESGTYEPRAPERFTVAKSRGFSRRMAIPELPDLVLYRTIVDYIYSRSKQDEKRHVYFEQEQLSKVQKQIEEEERELRTKGDDPFWNALLEESLDYETHSKKRYRAWLRYSQYRRLLIFRRVYPCIVTTDITNFFDSILYAKVAESLHEIAAPQGVVNLLFLLLERLSFRGELAENCRLGLPVDEFDCSRKLAHILLYPHDDRMVEHLGEAAYVRWMDDQNFGVDSVADGLKALAAAGASLSRLHLTANAGKSRVLSLSEARRHFHLDHNDSLDQIQDWRHNTSSEKRALAQRVRAIWSRAGPHRGLGEWGKVQKRFYLLAGRSRARFLRHRSLKDLLHDPQLTSRIAEYIRCSGTAAEHLEFIQSIWTSPEQIYEDVNLIATESLLRVEGSTDERRQIRGLASALLYRRLKFPGYQLSASIAPLLVLRFGDARSLPLLKSTFTAQRSFFPKRVIRSASIVYASYGVKQYEEVREVAAHLDSNYLAEAVRLVERILKYEKVPTYYNKRFDLRFDPITKTSFIDMRSLTALRLLNLNATAAVQSWVKIRLDIWRKKVSTFDVAMLDRLF